MGSVGLKAVDESNKMNIVSSGFARGDLDKRSVSKVVRKSDWRNFRDE